MEENINILDILEIIKKRYKVIAITTAITLIISIIISFFIITPKYEVNVKLFIGKAEAKTSAGYDNSEVQMYQNLLSTYSNVIKTNDLVGQALNEGNINLTASQTLKNLTVTPEANTQIMEISYEDTNKERAVEVINNVTKVFIQKSKLLIPNSNVQVVEKAAFPTEAASPNKKLYVIVGIILGILIGLGIVFVQEALDNTYRTKDVLEKELGLPVIGAIVEHGENAEEKRTGTQKNTGTGRRRKK